jgi:hypothetical protein
MSEYTEDTDTRYRLTSTSMIHSPGILKWLRAMYQTDPHRSILLTASTFPTLPMGTAIAYLAGSIEVELEDSGETAVLIQTNGYAAAEATKALAYRPEPSLPIREDFAEDIGWDDVLKDCSDLYEGAEANE